MDQPGPGVQAVRATLIINYSTACNRLTRLRDGLLFMFCWVMWTVVLTAIVNATEWEDLSLSFDGWFAAHRVFINALMASFHFPVEYVLLVIVLVCVFLIWSNLGMLFSMHSRDANEGALSLEDLAHHFGLDSVLIGAMQKEAQVIVAHAPSGAVIGVRCATPEAPACNDAMSLHLVV